jgi:hypothetical protein
MLVHFCIAITSLNLAGLPANASAQNLQDDGNNRLMRENRITITIVNNLDTVTL